MKRICSPRVPGAGTPGGNSSNGHIGWPNRLRGQGWPRLSNGQRRPFSTVHFGAGRLCGTKVAGKLT